MTVIRTVVRGTRSEIHAELTRRRELRCDIVAERAIADDRFAAAGGPFRDYERKLRVREDGSEWSLTETIRYRLAVPVWAWLFYVPVRRALARRRSSHSYWWAPPDRLDARTSTVLGLLCTMQVVDGYLGTVLTQTLTFAADEFGHGNTAQGVVLAVVRVGVLIALVSVAMADRYGRRRLIVASGLGSCIATALGALSPELWFLGGSQLIARGLSTALGVLIVIVAAEEMPARSRAWALSVLALCAGLGAGMAVWVLPAADLHVSAWRLVYLVPVLGVLAIVWAGRQLPESRRFEALATTRSSSTSVENTGVDRFVEAKRPVDDAEVAARRRRRLRLLATSAFLIALFAAPASGLQNDFLKDERGFSAGAISLFTLTTSTPAGIGILVGGYLADRKGRRPVGATGLALGAVAAATAFFTDGAALWLLTLTGVLVGAMTVPALGVYGPELFGTQGRGRANGLITTIGVTGSATGLFVAGWLSDSLGGQLGPALALLALGPLVVAVLVLVKFPETAGVKLEDLNPEDR